MKFKFGIFFLFLIGITSCSKKTVLETTFNCNNSSSILNAKRIKDIKKNFKISIPITWKTQLYYDEFQSDIFTADTTKKLTKTYIFDSSWKMGELELNTDFESKIKENTEFKIINSAFENIQEKPAYWYHSKGIKNNFDYNQLTIYIKTATDSYLEITIEVYGNENVNERLCESTNLIKTIEFI